MNARARRGVFLVGAVGVFGYLMWGVAGLNGFGHHTQTALRYANGVVAAASPLRHASNAVTTVVMDVRGVDTAGEELLLLAAIVGMLMVLRKADDEEIVPARLEAPDRVGTGRSRATSVVAVSVAAAVGVLGLYIVAHGQLTPGGGFQGGVVLAAPSILLLIGARHETFERFHYGLAWEIVQAIAVTAFLGVGVAGLIEGRGFLANIVGPGSLGTVYSAGTIALLNVIAGPAVATAVVLAALQIYHQMIEIRRER
ncbi:MAG TPA: MnhB domain-containing protein [Acidimicrobiia bacterium]|jgi:multicomponent Na+:H+ antiporter subunit B